MPDEAECATCQQLRKQLSELNVAHQRALADLKDKHSTLSALLYVVRQEYAGRQSFYVRDGEVIGYEKS